MSVVLKSSDALKNIIYGLIEEKAEVHSYGIDFIKFTNGLMFCFGTQTITSSINSSWGSLLASQSITGENYSHEFTEVYSVNITPLKGPTFWIGTSYLSSVSLSTAKLPNFYLLSATSQLNSTFVVGYFAVGKWK